MAEIQNLNIVANANTGQFPEGQQASTMNDGAREFQAMVARFYRDISGQLNSSGTGADYLVQPFRAIADHSAGNFFVFKAHVANTGAATLKIGALAAKSLRRQGGGALASGDISANQIVFAVWNAAGEYYEALGVRGGVQSNHLGTFAIADLPTGAIGNTAYATNGRKNGETEGNGTGVLVSKDATDWIASDSGAPVAA